MFLNKKTQSIVVV